MPKIVDHELQRAKFAEAAMRLVARVGFEGMTMRAVAAEAGLSYGSLFHYFESKDDLLMQAVSHSTAEQTRRVNEFSTRYKGLKALEQLLIDDAVVSASSRGDSVVWMAFLYRAALDSRYARMHARLIDGWVARIAELLEAARRAGEIRSDIDTEFEALAVWVYSAGIGQQGLLHPKLLPPGKQKRLITRYLQKLSA